tara:strand:+ start:1439 stop:2530 length:1092 start_codon:yes stop_codon:yes gene_type:complete
LKKKALITGITGQDGSYLAEFLLKKGYEVHGIKRRSSSFNTGRIDHIFQDPHEKNPSLFLHYGDLTDSSNIIRLISEIKPDEIYNLGAQSHVAVSFEEPEYTADVVALGALRILEAIRILNLEKKCKYYQASSSELYGKVKEIPQNELTPFYPKSPYAISKLFAFWTTINYRESYKIFACNGILFNHESPRRGETFVSRKITRGLSRVSLGLDKCLFLGNLDSKRDWGHAKDYVEMQWLMLQQKNPKDYVIATGKQYSVREFVRWTCSDLGIKIKFVGRGKNEKVVVEKVVSKKSLSIKEGDVIARVDKKYFRPSEVETLLGDARKASKDLGWRPSISSRNLCREMVKEDFKSALKEKRSKIL